MSYCSSCAAFLRKVDMLRTEMRETLDASAEKSAEINRLKAENERLRAAAKDVCWFDWSDNDDDAVEAVEKLRAALTPPAMNQEGGE